MKQPVAGTTNQTFNVKVASATDTIAGDAGAANTLAVRGNFSDWFTQTKFAKGSFFSNDMILSALFLAYDAPTDTTTWLVTAWNANPVAKASISADLTVQVMLIPPD